MSMAWLSRTYVMSAAFRAAGFVLVWLALTDGDLSGAWLAALSVAGATAASLALLPPRGTRWNLLVVPSFAWFFLRQSVLGGVDVARRALHPGTRVAPTFIRYEIDLASTEHLLLVSNITSLLPGTVVAEIQEDHLLVHVLDEGMPAARTLDDLTQRLAALTQGQAPPA